jgi:hypothetical protein
MGCRNIFIVIKSSMLSFSIEIVLVRDKCIYSILTFLCNHELEWFIFKVVKIDFDGLLFLLTSNLQISLKKSSDYSHIYYQSFFFLLIRDHFFLLVGIKPIKKVFNIKFIQTSVRDKNKRSTYYKTNLIHSYLSKITGPFIFLQVVFNFNIDT